MKPSDPKSKKTTKGERSKKGKQKSNDKPGEEFISPDPNRSIPEKNTEIGEPDKMGISKKTKNQSSDERDTSERKK